MKIICKNKIVKNSKPNKKLAVKKDIFVLPPSFLSSLSEFSTGGYVLIIGNEVGEPQVYSHLDDALQGLGMVKFGQVFFNQMDERLTRQIKENASLEMD